MLWMHKDQYPRDTGQRHGDPQIRREKRNQRRDKGHDSCAGIITAIYTGLFLVEKGLQW